MLTLKKFVTEAAGNMCNRQCSDGGCWGLGDHNCYSCRYYHYGKICMNSCEASLGLFAAGDMACQECDPECAIETNLTCDGPVR